MVDFKPKSYSPLLKILHWFVALTVICLLCMGFFLSDLPEQYQYLGYMLHKSFGLTVLWLMIIRFIIVHAKGKPPLPPTVKPWERILSRAVQHSFYLFLILMPLSGWIMSVAEKYIPSYFGLFNVPFPGIGPNEELGHFMGGAHYYIAWILIGLLVLHVCGALKHHFIDKDSVLKSMWFGKAE